MRCGILLQQISGKLITKHRKSVGSQMQYRIITIGRLAGNLYEDFVFYSKVSKSKAALWRFLRLLIIETQSENRKQHGTDNKQRV